MFSKCRLCLSEVNLRPLFKNYEINNEYSAILLITTGLKIAPNDGLPQNICESCSMAVDSALELRNRSQSTEKLLLTQMDHENNIANEKINNLNTNKSIQKQENTADCENTEGLLEYKLDDQSDSSQENGAETKWPPVKRLSKKEKRQMYLNLVEGTLKPNGPVKCKVCKNTVSKWSCFLSHAKLHLGFNFMCEFCGKSFITTTQLKRHCRSHHGMKRELKCQHCNYLALDNAQLKLHKRRVHTFERPYICEVCASSYHSRRCLIQHLESHRTEATVPCGSCPQVFKSRRALARHNYSAHTHKRVPCPHCARSCTRKYINVHINRCHSSVV